jgi:hypothetical protein
MGVAALLKKVNERSVTLMASASERKTAKQQSKKHETAGSKWFDLPATPVTPEIEKDLKVLSMRGAIDRKRHYRGSEQPGKSKYFQMGTVISDAAGFYGDRLTRKQRPQSLVDTLLKDVDSQAYFKRKYNQLQERYQAAGRGAHNKRPFKRTGSWNTGKGKSRKPQK